MNTLLAVAAIIGSITVPVGVITIASLRFVRKMMDDDTREERDAVTAAKEARKQAADAEREKREREEKAVKAAMSEERRKKNEETLLKKLDTLVFTDACGELSTCPLCNQKSAVHKKDGWDESAMSARGTEIFESAIEDPMGTSSDSSKTGPTTGVLVQTSSGPRIWQFCYRCGGMWLNYLKSAKPKKN